METWRKNLYILWGTQFVATIGLSMVIPFLPFYVRTLGVTDANDLALWSGIVFSGPFIISLFATPFWAHMGDRYGQKKMVVRALIGLAVSQALIGVSQNVYQLLLFRMVQGGISGFIASTLTLVSTSTPREQAGYAIGLLQSSSAAGMILGPFIGGIIADAIGYRQVFFITAAICLAGSVVIIKYVTETVRAELPERRPSIIENIHYLARHPQLRIIGVAIVLTQTATLMIESIFALFVEGFKTDSRYISTLTGGVFSIAGAFMFISAPWWGRRNDRIGFKRNITFATTVTGVAYIFHIVMPNILLLTALRAVLGFFLGGILPALYALTSVHAPEHRKSSLMGIAASFSVLGNLVGPLSGGLIAASFGLTTVFAVNSLLFLATGWILWKHLEERSIEEIYRMAEEETAV